MRKSKEPHRRRYHRHAAIGLFGSLVIILLLVIRNLGTVTRFATISGPGSAQVTRDVDGDTIDVRVDGRADVVRFIGVDTPETHDPRKPVQCFGQTAAAYTTKLVTGQTVRLVADPEDANRDKYNRLLRYVYLPDGTLLNEKLIQQGYGFAYVVFPFSKLSQFRADETTARQQNRGLWGSCQVDASSEIKQTAGSK